MFKLRLILLVSLIGISCTTTPSYEKEAFMVVESIPLKVFTKEVNSYHLNINLSVDGKKKELLLDTGAPSSRLPEDSDTKKYKVVEKDESVGVSGKGTSYDVIEPHEIEIGGTNYKNFRITRGGEGILGLDLLSKFIFRVDIKSRKLDILSKLPTQKNVLKIKRLKRGHVTIPFSLGNQWTFALFDTGSDASIIDLKFLQENQNLFKHLRSESGYDHNGNEIKSEIYSCKNISIANLNLKNIEFATFDFPPFLREAMEGTPIILGNNVIKEARWAFDLKSNLLVAE